MSVKSIPEFPFNHLLLTQSEMDEMKSQSEVEFAISSDEPEEGHVNTSEFLASLPGEFQGMTEVRRLWTLGPYHSIENIYDPVDGIYLDGNLMAMAVGHLVVVAIPYHLRRPYTDLERRFINFLATSVENRNVWPGYSKPNPIKFYTWSHLDWDGPYMERIGGEKMDLPVRGRSTMEPGSLDTDAGHHIEWDEEGLLHGKEIATSLGDDNLPYLEECIHGDHSF